MPAALPNRLRECRKRANMSMNALAERVGTSKSQIDKLERGERRLSLDWMIRLAQALGCHPIEFLPLEVGQRSQTDRWLAEHGIEIIKKGQTLQIRLSRKPLIQLSFCPEMD